MRYYPDEVIDEVRSKSDIVDVVSGYISLQKKGGSYWARCPFHPEQTPSFSVSVNKQMFHCFGCGVGGTVFTFVMKYEECTFPEAVRLLGERAGVSLPQMKYTEKQRAEESRKARLLAVNKEAAKFFYYQLRQPRGDIGYQYLKKRELSDETMRRFGLGYAGKNGAELVKYLRGKGFEDELIKEAGLANFSERHGLSSQFWNRVMFPIQDINHRVIGFGGRVMGDGEPKYLNSPETPVFDKRRNLYGLNYARRAGTGNIILCEGYMDVIAMHQAGFTQAVASLGTSFTVEQANLLRKYTKNVFLAYDSDGAGVKAALRNIGILQEAGLSGKVINLRPYKDPDEFMKALGSEAFQERIEQAENRFLFEARILEERTNMSDPAEKTEFQKAIAQKLCEFSDELERENYLEKAAEKYSMELSKLRELVVKYAAQTGLAKPVERPKSGVQQKLSPEEAARRNQRYLVTWIADEPSVYPKVRQYISAADFTNPLYRRAVERFFAEMDVGKCDPAGIVTDFEDEEEQNQVSALFQTELRKGDTRQDREKAFRDILVGIKEDSYRYYTEKSGEDGPDMDAIRQTVVGKRALEQLKNAHISLE